ncbi:MAG: DUF4143 domain-containing protein [Prevotella sp.]|nr:DUF4143 domain-containing protein [Prevotella sp.]
MKQYKNRVIDRLLADKLEAMGAVLIEGPKYCGKTTTGEQQARSVLYMADPEIKDRNLTMASTNIKRLLAGDTPRLIDEWQIAPKLWDAIRFEVDHRGEDGQFMLTGSAAPASTSEIFHSGTGRFGWIKMRTMSLWESGDSTGDVSLGGLFSSENEVDGTSNLEIRRIAFLVCRGGWPKASLKTNESAALIEAREYVESVCRNDISRVDDVQRNAELARRLMRSYSRHQGAQVSVATILADIKSNEASDTTEATVASYINALKRIFVIEDMAAWNPNLRSKTAIRSSDTRYFTDPSIAAAALGLGPDDLLDDPNTFGLLFETMAVRDLRVYAEALGGQVYHYRDKNGLECDAIVHLRNGRYGLIEIKLGGDNLIEAGATTLKKLASKIDTDKMKSPSFMMVLTAIGEYAYRRLDGVLVVPIGCLRD